MPPGANFAISTVRGSFAVWKPKSPTPEMYKTLDKSKLNPVFISCKKKVSHRENKNKAREEHGM